MAEHAEMKTVKQQKEEIVALLEELMKEDNEPLLEEPMKEDNDDNAEVVVQMKEDYDNTTKVIVQAIELLCDPKKLKNLKSPVVKKMAEGASALENPGQEYKYIKVGYEDRGKGAKLREDLEELLRIFPSHDVMEEIAGMGELKSLICKEPFVRDMIGRSKLWIGQLLHHKTIGRACDSNSLRAHMVAILSLLFDLDHNKSMIVQERSNIIMPFLWSCFTSNDKGIRRDAAMVVLKSSTLFSNRKIIGESGVIRNLVGLINFEEEDPEAISYAGKAIWYLCGDIIANRDYAVSAGAVLAVMDKIKMRTSLYGMLEALEVLSRGKGAIEQLQQNDMLECLFEILTEGVTEKMKEYCVVIIHSMCEGCLEKTIKINEVKNARQTLEVVVRDGTSVAREKAIALISRLVVADIFIEKA